MKHRFLLAALAALFLGGCATEEPKPTDIQRHRVNTMPWNSPPRGQEAVGMGNLINTR